MYGQNAKYKIHNWKTGINFGGFQSPELREKNMKIAYSYVWFSGCNQTYESMIQDFYFISVL
jgi:hypothetical protein